MCRYIPLSRAARLVGVKRGALQKKIRDGELSVFEGSVTLSELLRVYPNAQIEDPTMVERLERLERIKDAALHKVIRERVLPDVDTLAARVSSLSRELIKARNRAKDFETIVSGIQAKLSELRSRHQTTDISPLNELQGWLHNELQMQSEKTDASDDFLAKDTFLRIISAHIRIANSGHEFFVEGTDTLLDAGLRAGIAFNYGCINGECGLCKARVVSGEVKKVQNASYILSEMEENIGYVLMCCHTAITDVVLEAEEAFDTSIIPTQRTDAQISKIMHPNEKVVILRVAPPPNKRIRFIPGQRATLMINNLSSGEYSIASCPCDNLKLDFHIMNTPDNPFSNYVHNQLKIKDEIAIEGPIGQFVLKENTSRPLILVAFDTGFAPIKGLIEHAFALEIAETIHLYWIASPACGHYLHNLCRSWIDAFDNFHFTPLTTSPAAQSGKPPMDFAIEPFLMCLLGDHPDINNFDIYIAGPVGLLHDSREFLIDRGVSAEDILVEAIS